MLELTAEGLALIANYKQSTTVEKLAARVGRVLEKYKKGATSREVYLPAGKWYDWWTGEVETGGRTVPRTVDLATMPIYVRAGAIVPLDPIRQCQSLAFR